MNLRAHGGQIVSEPLPNVDRDLDLLDVGLGVDDLLSAERLPEERVLTAIDFDLVGKRVGTGRNDNQLQIAAVGRQLIGPVAMDAVAACRRCAACTASSSTRSPAEK